MSSGESVAVVTLWLDAADNGQIERLIELSTPDIELIGPRGSGHGRELLREWMQRAGLHLTTLRIFARDNAVVTEQHGVWRSLATGDITGELDLAARFRVVERRVGQFARYDNLDAALKEAGLGYSDEMVVLG